MHGETHAQTKTLPTLQTIVPGPKGLPMIGVAPKMKRETLLPYLLDMARTHGDFFRLPFPGIKIYILSNPDWVKHVLQDRTSNYVRSFFYDNMKPIFGNGILMSEGDLWRKRRRLMQPAFHAQRLVAVAQITVERLQEVSEALEAKASRNEPFDLGLLCMRLTLDVVTRALFSNELTVQQQHEISDAMDVIQDFMGESFWKIIKIPIGVPTLNNWKFLQAKKKLIRIIDQLIQDHRNPQKSYSDLLSTLVNAKDGAETLTDAQIRDEVMTLLLAGHETTANSLAWTFSLLLKHPDILTKLRSQIATVLHGRAPTQADLPQLPYVKWVLEESMRLYPPAYILSRKTLNDDRIGNYRVEKNSVVMLSPYLVQRNPGFWENPDVFNPDRFNPEISKGRHKFAYFPFGGGPHICIGASMAMIEAQLILATLIQKFNFIREEPLAGILDSVPDPLITIRLNPSLRVRVEPRFSAQAS